MSRTTTQPQRALHGSRRSYATMRSVVALVLREMATRYGRSPGGYVWALLEPLGMIIILGIAFSLLLRSPPLGNSFLLFYATGFLPFNLYQQLAATISRALVFSKSLLLYPAVTWVDAVLARFVLNALTGLLVTLVLISGLLFFTDSRTIIDIGPVVQGLSLALLLGFGLGVFNCALVGLFDIWGQVWSIATRPLFLMSGIIYLYDAMPDGLRAVLWWNPLIHIVNIMRTGFFPSYKPDDISITYVVSWGLVTTFLGVVMLVRYHRDILNNR